MIEASETGAKPADEAREQQRPARRVQAAAMLCGAIAACEPEDAAQICAAFLDSLRTSGPAHPFLNEVREEAEWWADCARVPELEAVTLAGLRRLGEMALGINARKRIFAALWDSFHDADRMNFARRVGLIGSTA